jgi:hypothetical protein
VRRTGDAVLDFAAFVAYEIRRMEELKKIRLGLILGELFREG